VLLCYFLTIIYLQNSKVTHKGVQTEHKPRKSFRNKQSRPKIQNNTSQRGSGKTESQSWRHNHLFRGA